METTVMDLIIKALEDGGYDGLYSSSECACLLSDLMPCGECCCNCSPGYLAECDCGDHDFHIVPKKVEQESFDEIPF